MPFSLCDVDPAVGQHRRRAVGAPANALGPVDRGARLGVGHVDDAAVVDHVEVLAVGHRRRHVGPVVRRPDDVRVQHVAPTAGPQRQQRPDPRRGVDHPVAHERRGHDAVVALPRGVQNRRPATAPARSPDRARSPRPPPVTTISVVPSYCSSAGVEYASGDSRTASVGRSTRQTVSPLSASMRRR